ncbi:hypothetical protein [Priestia megaterium]|uniref:hypothetical protein n=1 Tax=Priestia megaterium TaxID=1404 RepID=UPI0018CEF8FB|nr:hypothetical protein [Priestia megaterium]MBG9472277.1 hypothetical protein [Priestia megaterium]MDD9792551.1 hypothetical protein [Priestia megaterium]MDF2053167.1 hypothetical protein [Priestia megaterium]MDF2062559.1 hypothetical protein [Priestia megaterium]
MKYIMIGVFALIYSTLLDYLRDNYGLNYIAKLLILAILVGITYKIIEKIGGKRPTKSENNEHL